MEPAQLRRIRELMGWTQERAAAEAAVTENTWARWERGEMAVHPARVAFLRQTFQRAEKVAARRAARRASRAAVGAAAEAVAG